MNNEKVEKKSIMFVFKMIATNALLLLVAVVLRHHLAVALVLGSTIVVNIINLIICSRKSKINNDNMSQSYNDDMEIIRDKNEKENQNPAQLKLPVSHHTDNSPKCIKQQNTNEMEQINDIKRSKKQRKREKKLKKRDEIPKKQKTILMERFLTIATKENLLNQEEILCKNVKNHMESASDKNIKTLKNNHSKYSSSVSVVTKEKPKRIPAINNIYHQKNIIPRFQRALSDISEKSSNNERQDSNDYQTKCITSTTPVSYQKKCPTNRPPVVLCSTKINDDKGLPNLSTNKSYHSSICRKNEAELIPDNFSLFTTCQKNESRKAQVTKQPFLVKEYSLFGSSPSNWLMWSSYDM